MGRSGKRLRILLADLRLRGGQAPAAYNRWCPPTGPVDLYQDVIRWEIGHALKGSPLAFEIYGR